MNNRYLEKIAETTNTEAWKATGKAATRAFGESILGRVLAGSAHIVASGGRVRLRDLEGTKNIGSLIGAVHGAKASIKNTLNNK